MKQKREREKKNRQLLSDHGAESGEGDQWDLPEAIIQHILSFLSPNNATKMSLLSKTWYSAWSTYPILNLDLDGYVFNKVGSTQYPLDFVTVKDIRGKFMNYVDKSLQRYENHNISIQQLDFSMRRGWCHKREEYLFIKQLLGKVEKAGVKVLRVFYTSCGHRSTFPDLLTILGAKSLTEFRVKWVAPETEFSEPCYYDGETSPTEYIEKDHMMQLIKCCLLRRLFLESVYMDDNALESIISSCPLIEILQLLNCRRFKRIKVANLHKLKEFVVLTDYSVSVEVEAPSLESFDFRCVCILRRPSRFKLYSCQNLEKLSLEGQLIEDGFFQDLGKKFPNLETLSAVDCYGIERINLSSNSLKHISLKGFPDLRERPEINAPSIVSFEYKGDYVPCFEHSLGTNNSSHECKCSINIWESSSLRPVSSSLFVQLKEMLKKLDKCKISLSIKVHTIHEMENLRYIPNSGEYEVQVEDFNIDFQEMSSSSASSALVENIFLTCRPKTICLFSCTICDENFVKFLYQTLMDRTNPDKCNSGQSLFWVNDLKEANGEIVSMGMPGRKPGELVPVDWRILINSPDALCWSPLIVYFKLKW